MRYIVCTLLGAALMAFSLTALGYGVYQLLQIGTCATNTNTPYAVTRECPGGIGWLSGMLPGGIFGLLFGAAIYSLRGRAPGSDKGPNHGLLVLWVWTGLFWSIAAASLLGIYGPDAAPGQGGKLGGLIVAGVFVPMGAMGVFAFRSGKSIAGLDNMIGAFGGKGDGGGTGGNFGTAFGQMGKLFSRMSVSGGDPVSRIEALQRLREQGAIDDAEFQKLKKQALGE